MGYHLLAALILGILALTNAQEKYRCSKDPHIECVFTDGKNECEYSSYYGPWCYTASVWQYCKVCEEDKLTTTVSTTTENYEGSATSTVSTSTKGPERITTTTTITAPPSTRRSVSSETTKSTTTVSTSNPKLDTQKTTNTTIKEESTKTSAPISTKSTTTSAISSSSTKASTGKTEKSSTTVTTIKDNPTTTTTTARSSQPVSSTTTSTVPTTTSTTTSNPPRSSQSVSSTTTSTVPTTSTTTESNPVRYCSMNKDAPCKIPFTYKDKTYHECTGDGSTTGALWCYVTDPRIEYVYCEVCKVVPISTKQMTSFRNPTEPSVQELPLPLKAIPSIEANASSPIAQTQKATSVMPESKSLAPLLSSQTVSVKDLPLDEMQISPKTINSTPLSSTLSTVMQTQPVSSTTSPPKSKTAQKTTLVDRLLSTTTSSARPNLPPIPAATSSEANSHDTPIQMTEPSIKNESLISAPKTTPIRSVTDSKATSSPTSSTTTRSKPSTTSKSTTASSVKVKTSTIGSKRPATLTKSTTTITTLRSSTVKPKGVNPVQLSETDKGASSQDGSEDSDDNENGSDTVMIVVLVLVIFAMIVAVAIVVLCIRRRRRRNSIEKGVEVGGAGDKLLKQNGSNGSNKSVSPDGSQEMEPLTSKPIDKNASGDDVVIKGGTNSCSDNITKTVAM